MVKMAKFDAKGDPVAFYETEVNTHVPRGLTQITEEEWREFIEHPEERRWVGGKVVRVDNG